MPCMASRQMVTHGTHVLSVVWRGLAVLTGHYQLTRRHFPPKIYSKFKF